MKHHIFVSIDPYTWTCRVESFVICKDWWTAHVLSTINGPISVSAHCCQSSFLARSPDATTHFDNTPTEASDGATRWMSLLSFTDVLIVESPLTPMTSTHVFYGREITQPHQTKVVATSNNPKLHQRGQVVKRYH